MLDRFYNEYETELPILLPRLLNMKLMVSKEDVGDYIEIYYKPQYRYSLDEVAGVFEDDANMNILYESVESTAITNWHCVCAFPQATNSRMYKFNAITGGDGMVDTVVVRIYEDIEVFVSALVMELDLQLKGGNVKRNMNEADVFANIFV